MKFHMRKLIWLLAFLSTLLLATSQLSASENLEFAADEFWFDTAGAQVDVVTPFEFESMELRIRKRGETEVWTESFGPGVSLSVDLAHVVQSGLTDDRYTYEIRFVTGYKASDSMDQGSTAAEEPITYSTSGTFSVEDGSITDVSIPGSRAPGSSKGGTIQSDTSPEASGDPTPMDLSDPGDLAMGGYGVFGSSNTGDVIGGKVRVLSSGGIASFSVQAEASNGDDYAWHFGTQDGGDFALQRQRTVTGSKTTVLGIEEDAPANSLTIAQNGHIGFGTATPQNRMHIIGSGSGNLNPRIRYENTSHEQAWLAGAWSNDSFVIRDDTNGNTAFRAYNTSSSSITVRDGIGINTISPSAPLDVAGNARFRNDVGIGTNSPIKKLHIQGNDPTASAGNNVQLRVENTSGTTEIRDLMRLVNNGGIQFKMQTDSETWEFGALDGRFTINSLNFPGLTMRVNTNGNMTIAGTLTENSSREVKHDIRPLQANTVLDKLSKLEVSQWRYDSNPESQHIGPMAEDWHELFGLGENDKGVAPRDLAGVALAAAQALNERSQKLEVENSYLRERLDRLEASMYMRQ